ncbi:MAG TPA: hypothetical protein VME66_04555 [Candidatus Acidoferrales bacterium]|nr:hypothetical protein [Candidatus Acidoferrales bacterium]
MWSGDRRIGEVRDVYAEGDSRLPEYLAVYLSEPAREILIPTRDVATIQERGVVLVSSDPEQYEAVVTFVRGEMPALRKL